MDNFLLLKLNRAIWVAMLEQHKIIEGINYFECYCNDIASIRNRKNKYEVETELQTSHQFFLVIMKRLAQEFFDAKNYSVTDGQTYGIGSTEGAEIEKIISSYDSASQSVNKFRKAGTELDSDNF